MVTFSIPHLPELNHFLFMVMLCHCWGEKKKVFSVSWLLQHNLYKELQLLSACHCFKKILNTTTFYTAVVKIVIVIRRMLITLPSVWVLRLLDSCASFIEAQIAVREPLPMSNYAPVEVNRSWGKLVWTASKNLTQEKLICFKRGLQPLMLCDLGEESDFLYIFVN